MEVQINTKGGSVSYKIPILKAQTYNLDEIFEKKLYFLLPFYIFCYEKQFDKIEEDEERLDNLKYEKLSIIDMMKYVMKGIAEKYDKVREETIDVMGGKILEYEARTIKNEAYAEGQNDGYAKGQNDGIEKGAAGLIRILKRYNYDDESIIRELVNELGISVSKAWEYLS